MIKKRGRKKIDENLKKIKIQIYIEKNKVDNLGGVDAVSELLINYLNSKKIDKQEIIEAFEAGQKESALGYFQKKGEQYYKNNFEQL